MVHKDSETRLKDKYSKIVGHREGKEGKTLIVKKKKKILKKRRR